MTAVPEYLRVKKGDSPHGRSQKLSDTAFWLEDLPDGYIDLLAKIDSTKDPMPLLPLLNVPKAALPHFKDLFKRLEFRLRKRRGAPTTPSYQRTDYLIRLWVAHRQVVNRRRGVSRADAIKEAVALANLRRTATRQRRVTADAIKYVLRGKHVSYRNAKFPH
jgi:hypothetical protein